MTSPAALTVCSTSSVETPASPAPGAGASSQSRAFRKQLRDAHESLDIQPKNNGSEGNEKPKRAAAPEPEKKRDGDGDSNSPLPVQVVAIPSRVLPLSLDLGSLLDPEVAAGAGLHGPTDKFQPEALPDATTVAEGSQYRSGDLTFALRLDPQTTSDNGTSNANGQGAGSQAGNAQADAQAAQIPRDNNQADNHQIGQDVPAVRIETAIKSSTPGPPLKETRQGGPAPVAAPPAGSEASGRMIAFQTYEKTMTPAPAEPAAHPQVETAKALEAAALQTPTADHASKPSPLKDLSIQVGQLQHDKVELRVVERSGELQVAVRAANPDLAQGLRQGLSDLVDRLEQNGFRAEAWRPGTIGTAVEGAGDTRQKPMQFQQGSFHSPSGGSQQGRQQNQQNQTYRPRWVQELEGSFTAATPSSSGESYGISH